MLLYLGTVEIERLENPEIRLTACLELERTNGIVDMLKRVDNAVGVVISGVDAPVITSMRVGHVLDTIGHLRNTRRKTGIFNMHLS